jgi:hypothetical protein
MVQILKAIGSGGLAAITKLTDQVDRRNRELADSRMDAANTTDPSLNLGVAHGRREPRAFFPIWKKAVDFRPRLFAFRIYILVASNANANTGSAETDTAAIPIVTVVIAPALDVALARSVIIRITVSDDDAAFTVCAPATAVFITNHADVLNVACRCNCYVGG